MNNVYLSGPEWLTRRDCKIYNVIAGMFTPEDWISTFGPYIHVTADEIYEAMPDGQDASLEEIVASVRKLALTRESDPELLAVDMGLFLLYAKLVMGAHGWCFSIPRPSLRQIVFDEIIYIGGKRGYWGRT